ncbi:hypothetical protein B4Q13_18615 [Lacticaseibacillus rhamnosus]
MTVLFESKEEAKARWKLADSKGRIRASSFYLLAKNSYGCHVDPQEELGRKQSELGKQQVDLGSKQAALGTRQATEALRSPAQAQETVSGELIADQLTDLYSDREDQRGTSRGGVPAALPANCDLLCPFYAGNHAPSENSIRP